MSNVEINRLVRLTAAALTGAVLAFGCSTPLMKSRPKEPSAPQYAHPKYPGLTERKKESKSWFGPEEPQKDKTVNEWMKKNKQINL